MELVVFDAVHLENQLPGVPITRVVQNASASAAKVMELAGKLIREVAVPAKIEVPCCVVRPASPAQDAANDPETEPPHPSRSRARKRVSA
jgi:hypothetical protein